MHTQRPHVLHREGGVGVRRGRAVVKRVRPSWTGEVRSPPTGLSAPPSSLAGMDYDDVDGDARVEITKGELEILLHFARIGDRAASQRTWRNWFRHQSVCSGEEREPDCAQCHAFTSAEVALAR